MPEGTQYQEKQNKRLSVAKCKRLFIFLTASSGAKLELFFYRALAFLTIIPNFATAGSQLLFREMVFAQSSFSRAL